MILSTFFSSQVPLTFDFVFLPDDEEQASQALNLSLFDELCLDPFWYLCALPCLIPGARIEAGNMFMDENMLMDNFFLRRQGSATCLWLIFLFLLQGSATRLRVALPSAFFF
jgi:hypothetical protein